MPVISFVSSKGGVGKTTGAVVLAGELVASGRSVIMIDADPNQPLISWSGLQSLPPRLSVVADQSAETIIDTIEDARAKADFVIVDLEGTATDRIGFAIARSDLVLIPLQASVLDATEAVKSIKLIRQMSRVAGRGSPTGSSSRGQLRLSVSGRPRTLKSNLRLRALMFSDRGLSIEQRSGRFSALAAPCTQSTPKTLAACALRKKTLWRSLKASLRTLKKKVAA